MSTRSALGGDVIGKKQCQKLRQFIMNLENLGKLNELLSRRSRTDWGAHAARVLVSAARETNSGNDLEE